MRAPRIRRAPVSRPSVTMLVWLVVLAMLLPASGLAGVSYRNRNRNYTWPSLDAFVVEMEAKCAKGFGTVCTASYLEWRNPDTPSCGDTRQTNNPCWYLLHQHRASRDRVISYGEVFVERIERCPPGKPFDRARGVCAASAKTPPSCPSAGNPIHLATGNKHLHEPDYRSPVPDGLEFTRRYASEAVYDEFRGVLGKRWRHSYQRGLRLRGAAGAEVAVVKRADGRGYALSVVRGFDSSHRHRKNKGLSMRDR